MQAENSTSKTYSFLSEAVLKYSNDQDLQILKSLIESAKFTHDLRPTREAIYNEITRRAMHKPEYTAKVVDEDSKIKERTRVPDISTVRPGDTVPFPMTRNIYELTTGELFMNMASLNENLEWQANPHGAVSDLAREVWGELNKRVYQWQVCGLEPIDSFSDKQLETDLLHCTKYVTSKNTQVDLIKFCEAYREHVMLEIYKHRDTVVPVPAHLDEKPLTPEEAFSPNEKKSFEQELSILINIFSKENESNTPDFILAKYMASCLDAFIEASRAREKWYGKELSI